MACTSKSTVSSSLFDIKRNSYQHWNRSNNYERYRQEVVLPSEWSACGKDNILMSFEILYIIIILNFHNVSSCYEFLCYHTPKLAKVRKTTGTHPDNEMFVFNIYPIFTLSACIKFKFIPNIIRPSYACFTDSHLSPFNSCWSCMK